MRKLVLLAVLFVPSLAADTTPASVALLVNESDAAALVAPLTEAMKAPAALTRAAGARVAMVRGATALVASLREAASRETDPTAAREELRAIALLGDANDVAFAIAESKRWPASMDDSVANAVARRGIAGGALDVYFSKLRMTRMASHRDFFNTLLWRRPEAVGLVASRLIAANDEEGWSGFLFTMYDSKKALPGEIAAVSLASLSEEIRTRTTWYLVSGYALDPSLIPAAVREAIAKPRSEPSSDREDFGRELLRRMVGGEMKNDPRWLRWLATEESDRILGRDHNILQYFTAEEYQTRRNYCGVKPDECAIPPRSGYRQIPSQDVAPPQFAMPAPLPAGLADAILESTRCRDSWLGVGSATVDVAGRVQSLDLKQVETTGRCREALEALLRLSLASNASIASELTSPVLLVRAPKTTPCLDEAPPSAAPERQPRHGGGKVTTPKVVKRVEPQFPASARAAMGSGSSVLFIAEATISSSGCMRNIRVLRQSPFPELNGAAVMAISQWKLEPGRLDGIPVDVLFNLTVSFKVTR